MAEDCIQFLSGPVRTDRREKRLMEFKIAAATDVGIKKKTNQDSLMVRHFETHAGNMVLAVLSSWHIITRVKNIFMCFRNSGLT